VKWMAAAEDSDDDRVISNRIQSDHPLLIIFLQVVDTHCIANTFSRF
jgi:hypothetical protein